MPTYEYRCNECGHEFEEIQTFTAPPLTKCPSCHKPTLTRVIGGAGLIFKGEGFYITDYKKSGKDGEKKGTKKKEKVTEKSTPSETKTTSSEKTES